MGGDIDGPEDLVHQVACWVCVSCLADCSSKNDQKVCIEILKLDLCSKMLQMLPAKMAEMNGHHTILLNHASWQWTMIVVFKEHVFTHLIFYIASPDFQRVRLES